jgi:hypothetical protein
MFSPDHTLLNGTELADRLNVDRRFVTAMRAQGFEFTLGGRTTLTAAHTWLRENPKFRVPARPRRPKSKRHASKPKTQALPR